MAEDLGARLVRAGLATREQLADALAAGPVAGGTLAVRLTERGVSEEELLGLFLADGFVLEEDLDVPRDVLARIHPDMAVSLMALPLRTRGEALEVAMIDPSDLDALKELRHSLGQPVQPRVARVSEMKRAMQRAYPTAEARPSGPPVALLKRKQPHEPLVEANDGEIVLPLVRTKSFKKIKKTFARPDGINVPRAEPEASYQRPPSKSPPRSGLTDEATQQLDLADLEPQDAGALLAEAKKLGLISDTTQELSAADLVPLGLDPTQTEELDLNDVEVVAMLLQKRKKKAQPEPKSKSKSESASASESESESASEATPKPKAKPSPSPKTKPMPIPMEQPAAPAHAAPAPAPEPDPAPAPAPEPEPDPAPEPAAEPAKSAPEPGSEPSPAAERPKTRKSIIPPSEASWADLGAGFADSREGAKTVRQETNAREYEIGSVLASIRASADRDAIVRLACEACTQVARSAIFLALRKGVLRGWEGVGPGIASDAIRNLWIPATAPSMFKTVLETSEPHRGAYGTSAADNLYRAATGSRGGTLIIQPVLVAGNLVAVLCADGVKPGGEERVEVLAHAVGQALKRLIVAKKN